MILPINGLMYCRITESNIASLRGESAGQYDIARTTDLNVAAMFENLPEENATQHGGWQKKIPIEAFEGISPVPAQYLEFRYMGAGASRANEQYIRAQRPSTAYPLWRVGRAFPEDKESYSPLGDYIVIARDMRGKFHARWIKKRHVSNLPSVLQNALANAKSKRATGMVELDVPLDVSPLARITLAALRKHHNVLVYGPPGTGKTHLLEEVRALMSRNEISIDTTKEEDSFGSGNADLMSAWATFHQSYSYEDFLVGLRPRPLDGGGFALEPVPGILLELSEWARGEKNESLLIIDEINRGNVSRIFGEFITLMEPDKRLAPDGSATSNTIAVRLPAIPKNSEVEVDLPNGHRAKVDSPFTMPYALYTIATMNSVDKSVAPIDAALRRRFHTVELAPDFDLLLEFCGVKKSQSPLSLDSAADVVRVAVAVSIKLNSSVATFLGSEFQFGHWHLAPLRYSEGAADAISILSEIWRSKFQPQLEDYFAGRGEQLVAILKPASSNGVYDLNEPTPEYAELGGMATLSLRHEATDAEIASHLLFLAQ